MSASQTAASAAGKSRSDTA